MKTFKKILAISLVTSVATQAVAVAKPKIQPVRKAEFYRSSAGAAVMAAVTASVIFHSAATLHNSAVEVGYFGFALFTHGQHIGGPAFLLAGAGAGVCAFLFGKKAKEAYKGEPKQDEKKASPKLLRLAAGGVITLAMLSGLLYRVSSPDWFRSNKPTIQELNDDSEGSPFEV